MINRRSVVLSAPVLALAGSGAAETPDPHAEWVAEHHRVVAAYNASRCDIADEGYDARRFELEELICFTPATTAAGALAQLEFAMSDDANFEMIAGVWKNLDGALMDNVIKTLKSLT